MSRYNPDTTSLLAKSDLQGFRHWLIEKGYEVRDVSYPHQVFQFRLYHSGEEWSVVYTNSREGNPARVTGIRHYLVNDFEAETQNA